jgi:hypothetical protein
MFDKAKFKHATAILLCVLLTGFLVAPLIQATTQKVVSPQNLVLQDQLNANLNVTSLYCTSIDALSASGIQILNLTVENGTAFPSDPKQNQVFWKQDEALLYVYNDTWVPIGYQYQTQTLPYTNITGTPDLTVYLFNNGTRALTGDWNLGGSYGVYGATWLNSTSISLSGNLYFNGGQAINMTIELVTSLPTTAQTGRILYYVGTDRPQGLYIFNSTSWDTWTLIGGTPSSPPLQNETLLDSLSVNFTNGADFFNLYHEFPTYEISAVGQCFTVPSDSNYTLSKVLFYVNKTGSPVGSLCARIYDLTGTYGTTGKPTGNSLAVSDPVAMTYIGNNYTLITFSFSSSNRIVLGASEKYGAAVVVNQATTIDGSNFFNVAVNTTTTSHSGNTFYYPSTTWTEFASDTIFSVYGFPNATVPSTSATKVKTLQILWGTYITSQLLEASANFDMISLGNWHDSGTAYTSVPTAKILYPNLKVVGYIDILGQVQGLGYTDFNIASSNYWGYYVLSEWNTYLIPNSFDGVFLDDLRVEVGYPATSSDIITLLQWLKARAPNMLIVGNTNWYSQDTFNYYEYCDLGMWETFVGNPARTAMYDIDKLGNWTDAGRNIATFHTVGWGVITDTEANCRYALACYLCAIQNNNGYFNFADYWQISKGWYSLMDIDPGTPLGDYHTTGNWIYRNFTNVNVQANLVTHESSIIVS